MWRLFEDIPWSNTEIMFSILGGIQTDRVSDGMLRILTQFVGGGDNVGGNTRIQIGIHDAQRVQLGYVVAADLQQRSEVEEREQ